MPRLGDAGGAPAAQSDDDDDLEVVVDLVDLDHAKVPTGLQGYFFLTN
jgi:hypothetical protein